MELPSSTVRLVNLTKTCPLLRACPCPWSPPGKSVGWQAGQGQALRSGQVSVKATSYTAIIGNTVRLSLVSCAISALLTALPAQPSGHTHDGDSINKGSTATLHT